MAVARWILVMWLAQGCIRPHLHSGTASGDPRIAIVGENIFVSARWYRTCSDRTGWSDGEAQEIECETRESRLQVAATGSCHVRVREQERADVVATGPGICRIEATSTRLDNGKIERETFELQIVEAEPELYCFGDLLTWRRCTGNTVSASDPRLHAYAAVGDSRHGRDDLTINGIAVGAREVSLTDLFPEHRDGRGIRPGRYELEVAYGGTTRTFVVAAR